jgi:hypothetical protein
MDAQMQRWTFRVVTAMDEGRRKHDTQPMSIVNTGVQDRSSAFFRCNMFAGQRLHPLSASPPKTSIFSSSIPCLVIL